MGSVVFKAISGGGVKTRKADFRQRMCRCYFSHAAGFSHPLIWRQHDDQHAQQSDDTTNLYQVILVKAV
jgi:hypothetical protein